MHRLLHLIVLVEFRRVQVCGTSVGVNGISQCHRVRLVVDHLLDLWPTPVVVLVIRAMDCYGVDVVASLGKWLVVSFVDLRTRHLWLFCVCLICASSLALNRGCRIIFDLAGKVREAHF